MKKWGILIGISVIAIVGIVASAIVLIGDRVPTDDPIPATPIRRTTADVLIQPVQTATAGMDEAAMTPDSTQTTDRTNTIIGFPVLRGTNLSFEEVTIPTDLDAGPKLIVVSYDDAQQPIVDEWLPPLEALNTDYPDLAGYYIPLLPKDAADAAAFIIGGFVALSDEDERGRTIIVFTNVAGFNDIVGIEELDDVQLFLLDADNAIIWRATGSYTTQKLDDLTATLAAVAQE